MKSKIFIFTTLILVVFLFVITSCDNFLNAKNKTTININLDLSKILKTSRNETTTSPSDYILKVFAYNAATYKPKDEIQNLPLLTQTENKVDINGNVKASLDIEIGLNVIFVAKLYQGKSEKPLYAGKSEVIKIKATDNKVHLVLTRENADLDIDILVHEHTFATEWTSDATHHWHEATCEHTTEVSGKAEHSFGEYVSNNDATTEKDGTKTRECSVCGYKDTVTAEDSKIIVPEGFVFVKGTTINGNETWTPSSEVFVSARKLTIRDLLVSDHEVTRGEYLEVMKSDPSTADAYDKAGNKLTEEDVLNNPVNEVSWYDALVYCNKRSMAEGLTPCYSISDSTDPDNWGTVPTSRNSTWDAVVCDWKANGYRLPTEAEWEWLARGGENYTYAGSNSVTNVAWYTGNTNDTGTREVKTKASNGYELYDMCGSVLEWCWDWYGGISDSTVADGVTSGSSRVFRGGSWRSTGSYCQVAHRNHFDPSSRGSSYGFRVVRPATEVIENLAHTHKFATDWTSDATHHWHAATCEHITEVNVKAAHSFGNWTTTKEATEEAEGSRERSCTVCGYTATEVIEKLAHTHTFTDGICVCGLPEDFVLIPAGTFQMGSNDGYSDNKPVHQVTITKSFYMGKYEVTQAEYEKYCSYTVSSSPSSSYGDGDNYPAYFVSWYDALVYCNKRSTAEGLTPCYSISDNTDPSKWGTVPTSTDSTWDAVVCDWNANGYRLPTEAEWEYAARAGDNTVYSLTYSGTSDENKLLEYAWLYSNSNNATHEVGTKLQNAYGLYDMSGNVWEWCWNWFTDSYDTGKEGGSDPTGTSAGSSRIRRGGGFGNFSYQCAVSFRYTAGYPGNREKACGVRVVRTATE